MREGVKKQHQHNTKCFGRLTSLACIIAFVFVLWVPNINGYDGDITLSSSPYQQRSILETESISKPSTSEREAAAKIIDNSITMPRYIFFTNNLKLTRYPAAFCGGENVDNCDTKHYAESIFLTSGIGFLVAAISLIMGILFWAFRCCCFGGCHASDGFFIPGDRFDEGMGEGYTTKHVTIIKILCVATLVCLVPFFVVGHVGNAAFSTGVNDFTGTVMEAANTVIDNLKYINTTLASLEAPPELNFEEQIQEAISSALAAGEQVTEKGKTISDEASYYNSIRERVILAGLILPLCMVAVTVVAALFNLAPLSLVTAILGFIVLSYGWIAFSIHYPLSLVATDVCVTFDNGGLSDLLSIDPIPGENVTYPLYNVSSTDLILNALIECGLDNTNSGANNPFKPLLDVAQNGLTYAYELVCQGFNTVCNTTYECPTDNTYTSFTTCKVMDCPANLECNRDTVSEYMRSNITDFTYGCVFTDTNPPVAYCPYEGECPGTRIVCDPKPVPFNECPDQCRLQEARDSTSLVIRGLNLLNSYNDILVNHIFPLLDCKLIADTLKGVQDALCVTLVNSLTYISTGEAGLSSFMIVGVVLSILGIKRFSISNRIDKDSADDHY